MRKSVVILSIVFLFIALYTSNAFAETTFDSLHGTIIESGTGVPVEGAVVVRHWNERGFIGEGGYAAEETVSDKDGKFNFPKKVFDVTFNIITGDNNIVEMPPVVFKSGYKTILAATFVKKDVIIEMNKLPKSLYIRMEDATRAKSMELMFVNIRSYDLLRNGLYMNAIDDEINSLENTMTRTTLTRPDTSGTEVLITGSSISDLDFFDDKGILFFDNYGTELFYKYGKYKATLTKTTISWGKDKDCDSTIGRNKSIYILEDKLKRKCLIGFDMKPVEARPSPLIEIQIDKKTGKFLPPTPEPTPFKITPMTPYKGFNEYLRTFTLSRRKNIFIASGLFLEKFKEDGTKICEMEMPDINIGPALKIPKFIGLTPVSNDSIYGLVLEGEIYDYKSIRLKYHYMLVEIDGKCNVVNSKRIVSYLEPKGIASTPDDKAVIADDAGFSVYSRNYDLLYRHNFDANYIGMTNIRKIKIDDAGNVFLIDDWPFVGLQRVLWCKL